MPTIAVPPGASRRLNDRLVQQVDGSSLAVFRIAFGGILVWEVIRYFQHGWIQEYWIQPAFHFTYHGFSWLSPWPGSLMYAHFVVMGVAAAAVCVGARFRMAAPLLWLLFTFQFLLEQARYLNHFYAASLLAFLLMVTPAHATWSVDRLTIRRGGSETVPAWSIWILRFQVAVIYFYAGVAKLSTDWATGASWRPWLEQRRNIPAVGMLLERGWEGPVFGVGATMFDLLLVPALLWRRTRPFAFAVAVVFHFTNAQLFRIGIFPWMMIAATTLFFAPDWPKRLFELASGAQATERPLVAPGGRLSRLQRAALGAYVAVQLILPLRHWFYPGDVAWTEEGHRYAWRMMLRSKHGATRFVVETPAGRATVDPGDILAPWQAAAMAIRPDMIQQFAHHLAARARDGGAPWVRVHAIATATLNGGPKRVLVNPEIDLAAQARSLRAATWIVRDTRLTHSRTLD